MKLWLTRGLFVAAVLFLLFTVVNASWLASPPKGALRLIAHRGVAQQFDRRGVTDESCTASRIEQPVHDFVENTTRSMDTARRLGADIIEVDVATTADGEIALFHDAVLECRTDGRGPVARATMAELRTLDVGHGYTANGGRTFPLRGRRKDRIPTLREALAALPATPIMFNFKDKDAAEADRLAAALKAVGRHHSRVQDSFYGASAPVERIKQHFPAAWAWSLESAERCTKDYLLYGWTSVVPESCRDGTMIVPLNYQWLFAGWPNRLMQRMRSVGARVIVTGPYRRGEPNTGLTLPEQLGDIPSRFTGYIWVEDIWSIGPALRPHKDFRTQLQIDAAAAGLERRRAKND